MISAAQAKAMAAANSQFITLGAIRDLQNLISEGAANGRTAITLIARSFPKDQLVTSTLTEFGYRVTITDRDDGDWELTVDWSA